MSIQSEPALGSDVGRISGSANTARATRRRRRTCRDQYFSTSLKASRALRNASTSEKGFRNRRRPRTESPDLFLRDRSSAPAIDSPERVDQNVLLDRLSDNRDSFFEAHREASAGRRATRRRGHA